MSPVPFVKLATLRLVSATARKYGRTIGGMQTVVLLVSVLVALPLMVAGIGVVIGKAVSVER